MAKFTLVEESAAPARKHPKFALVDEYDPTGSFTENLAAGSGKAIVDTARGLEQVAPILERGAPLPLKLPMMAARKIRELVTGRTPEVVQAEIDESKRLDAPLMETGGGMAGNIGTQAAMFALAPAANTAKGAAALGSSLASIQPLSTDDNTALNKVGNILTGGVVAGGSQALLNKGAAALKNRAASKAAASTQDEALNATRDAVLEQSRQAGYKVPAAQINPSLTNKTLESVGGKIAIEQEFSAANQKVSDTLARQGLGLKKDSFLTEGSLADMRREAGKAYEAIKKADVSKVGGKMNWDDQFQKDIADIGADFSTAAKEFPESTSNAAIEKLNRDLTIGAWSPTAIIEKVKLLRKDATANFKAFSDPEKLALARAQRQAADALDGLMERRLADSGQAELSAAYKNARQLIAKTHDVEAALTPGGHIDARILGKYADRLTGELKTIGDFGATFHRAAGTPEKIGSTGVTTLRSGLGAAVGTLMGGPLGAAAGAVAGAAGPWTVRQLMMSGAGQKLLGSPSYGGGGGTRKLGEFLANPALRAGLPPAVAAGSLEYRQ